MKSSTQFLINNVRHCLLGAAMSIFAMGSLGAAPMYYTFEGVVSGYTEYDTQWVSVYGPAVGDPVRYVFKVDVESEATNTLDTGEVIIVEDIDNSYADPGCSDGWCDDWYHYFYADHIYGDYVDKPSIDFTSLIEINSGRDRYRESPFSVTESSRITGDSDRNRKEISIPDKLSADWVEGDVAVGVESYEGGYLYSDLTLTAISATSPVTMVGIDVQPKSTNNIVRMKSKALLQVAVLSSDSFDATQVDPDSVRLGRGGAAVWFGTTSGLKLKVKDVDRDGDPDLLMGFALGFTGVICGDTQITLTAETWAGEMITGTDSIATAQCN